MASTGSPVSLASVVMGTAIAPNATGAVFATRATVAAFIGLRPSAMSITELMATGVPNPARASISAPKQKAMIIAWMRCVADLREGTAQRVEVPGASVML